MTDAAARPWTTRYGESSHFGNVGRSRWVLLIQETTVIFGAQGVVAATGQQGAVVVEKLAVGMAVLFLLHHQ